MKQKSNTSGSLIKARVKEFGIPPVHDGLVLGKRSPIGCVAVQKALSLLSANQFEHIEIEEDDIVSDVLIRAAILRKLSKEKLTEFVLQRLKPLMSDVEILHLDLEVEVVVEEQL